MLLGGRNGWSALLLYVASDQRLAAEGMCSGAAASCQGVVGATADRMQASSDAQKQCLICRQLKRPAWSDALGAINL